MRSLNIKYIPELDQLRAIAALLVIFYHAIAGRAVVERYMGINEQAVPLSNSVIELVIVNGFTGVSLFFVISGFLFTWGALQVSRIEWRSFYTNRVLRIYPLFVLLNLAAFSLAWGDISFGQLVQSLLGFGNLYPAIGDFDRVLWTIAVELQFYMLFPFLIALLKRQGVAYMWGLVAVMILLRLIARAAGMSLHDPIYWTLFGRLDQFLIGIIVAWYAHGQNWLGKGSLAQSGRLRTLMAVKLGLGLGASILIMISLFWLYTKLGWKYGESYLQVIWPSLEGLAWALLGGFYIGLDWSGYGGRGLCGRCNLWALLAFRSIYCTTLSSKPCTVPA
jgi:peptidoglycan/LPS O-acetylase OafA/YrhL